MSLRDRWASLAPFGVGHRKPRHFASMAQVAWQNRDRLPYAWRILADGVCDGCALGTTGLRDWTIDGIHLCMVRLELLRLNTMPALERSVPQRLEALAGEAAEELRQLGRLAEPLIRRRGETGFQPVSWDEAIDAIAERLRRLDPQRVAFYLTSRGIPNETYYVAQKAARFLGTPHVDNSARLCHAASTVAMKRAFGHGASTGSYRDWLEADLIVFFGSNTPNNQPVTVKYLHYAKRRGCEIAVVNPYREPGLERYWVPSVVESALFGTPLCDHWFEVDTGGDLAFLNGVLKALFRIPGGVDETFLESHARGLEELRESIEGQEWEELERLSGVPRERMESFAALLVERPRTIFVWSMGLTQHAHGVDTVAALCNLGLARGLLGRPGCGLTPIRGHSGVQGGAEVGCVPVSDPEVLDRWKRCWGFDPPQGAGLATMQQIEAAAAGELDAFWLIGGNFLGTVPDAEKARNALSRPALRVHQDIVLTPAMLVEPSDLVVLLPATTRYEIAGGVTETTTERRIVFSPEIPGPRISGARPEWEALCEVMARVHPHRAEQIHFANTAAIRAEIARAVPLYRGIETLHRKGDQVQWGGARLFEEGRFATGDGRARLVAVPARSQDRRLGEVLVSTRRGKQFNSMLHAVRDPLTGAAREDVLMASEDAEALGLADGEPIRLRSSHGILDGWVKLAPIKAGNVEVHWPEGTALLPSRLDPQSGEPDYNTTASIERRTTEAGG